MLHLPSTALLILDQLQRASLAVQRVPERDPLWARLILAGLPSVFALVLAWLVFSWNRKRDDRRWVLENKKTEWQSLLELASKVEQFTPSVGAGRELIGPYMILYSVNIFVR